MDLNQTRSSLMDRMKTLQDILEPGIKTLFVGTNPGAKSARIGHYFAGTSNMFWKLLYESKLTEERLTTESDYKVLDYGYGLTDVVKRPTRSTTELRRKDAIGSKKRLDMVIEKYEPDLVAFVGKAGYRYYLEGLGLLQLNYGLQEFEIAESQVFLLPSSSGQSYADTSYKEKLFWYKKLKRKIRN